jgi:flagellar biosynthesis protein FlhG
MAFNNRHPIDQAHRLRQLVSQQAAPGSDLNRAAAAPRSAHVIAVASGKGGVGKTMIAVNLSIALAARGHRVILFDLDMGLANADIILGLEADWTWSEVLSGGRSIDEVILQAPGQIALVPGASGVAHLANLSEFERHRLMAAMQQIESRYDVVVLDCGAGISRNVVGFGTAADSVLVVATPEPTAITDAYAMIKAFAQQRDVAQPPPVEWAQRRAAIPRSLADIGVLVNVAESRREGKQTFERLASVAARFLHLPITDYGCILRDDHVPSAVRQRSPVILRYPRCPASTCLVASAARLSRELGQPQGRTSLFYRVMNMFV